VASREVLAVIGSPGGLAVFVVLIAVVCVGLAVYFLVSYARGTGDYAWTKNKLDGPASGQIGDVEVSDERVASHAVGSARPRAKRR
jgi:hypothetical protein